MKKNKERVRDGSSSNSRNNICQNTITGTNGAKGVGVLNFGNVVVQGQGGGEEMKGFPERGRDYNISGNTITADGVGTSKIGIQNFGNTTTYGKKEKSKALQPNMSARGKGNHNNEGAGSSRNDYPQNVIKETSGATDVRISPHGSSDTVWTNARGGEGKKPKGVGEDISGNEIKGDGAPEGFHNFSNTNKTTNEEDDGISSNIYNNSVTAVNRAKCVGLSNFQNVNASQGQGGREGEEDFPNPNPSAISHNIHSNNISAHGSEIVGFINFGNTQYLKTT